MIHARQFWYTQFEVLYGETLMRVLDPGHVYELDQLGGGTQIIRFVKRSGGAITYPEEWPGVQVQEVLRALIDRTKYLYDILPCHETADALEFLREALYLYEVRAWRRKYEGINRKEPAHDDGERHRAWRGEPEGVPFTSYEIELLPIGPDGHILFEGS